MKNKLKPNFKDKKTIIISILIGLILIGLIIFICTKIFHKDKELTPDNPTTNEFENICGNSGMAPLMIVSAVPLFNIYSVVILTMCGRDSKKGKAGIKKAFFNILKNPIIIGIVAGVPFSLLSVNIPTIPMKTINYIAQTATPVALIAIGAGFNTNEALAKIKPAVVASVIKLVILPAIFLPLAIMFGFNSSEIIAILIMVGAPTTITCYIMAKNMENDEVLSSNVIVLTTLLSSVTLTLWVFVLKSLGYIG